MIFRSLKLLNIPDNSISKVEDRLVIDTNNDYEQCRQLRSILWRLSSDLRCVPIPNFDQKLIPGYIDYLRKSTQPLVGLIYSHTDGKIIRKYKTSATAFLCGIASQLDVCFPTVARPVLCNLKYTVSGFRVLSFQTSPKYFVEMEKNCLVSVKIFRDFAEVNGLFRSNVEAAVEDLVTYLGNHFISTEYSSHSQVPSLVIIFV